MSAAARARRRRLRALQALLVVAWALTAVWASGTGAPATGDLRLVANPKANPNASQGTNPLGLSNSKNGVAVLGASGMTPGATATGTVTLTNTGNVDAELALQRKSLHDTTGPGGGALSAVLQLRVQDVTNAASPVTVYDGRLATMPDVALGAFPKKSPGRTYRFTVTLPQSAGDQYESASTRVDYVWVQTKANGNGPKGK